MTLWVPIQNRSGVSFIQHLKVVQHLDTSATKNKHTDKVDVHVSKYLPFNLNHIISVEYLRYMTI